MIYNYDIETFPNFFSIAYWSIDGEIKERLYIFQEHSDLDEIINLFRKDNNWFVGYNSSGFDDPIIDWMINNYGELSSYRASTQADLIHKQAEKVINDDRSRYKDVSFNRFDLWIVNGLDRVRKPLKMVGVNLKYPKIQDLPYKPDHLVSEDEVEEILDYGDNDVGTTDALYHHSRDKIILRKKLSKKYGINLMNESRSSIANRILERDYAEATGQRIWDFKNVNTERDIVDFGEIINEKIEFITPQANKLLEDIKQTKANADTKVEYSIRINGTKYDIKKGGIHSHMPAEIFEASDDIMIKEADVMN